MVGNGRLLPHPCLSCLILVTMVRPTNRDSECEFLAVTARRTVLWTWLALVCLRQNDIPVGHPSPGRGCCVVRLVLIVCTLCTRLVRLVLLRRLPA